MTTTLATNHRPLSPREAQITQHIAEGETDKQMARFFHCAPCTVKSHAEHARLKLQAENRAHLVARAFESGILYSTALLLITLTLHALLADDLDMRSQRVGTRITRTTRTGGRKVA